jgi:hypothetical protein
MTNSLTSPASPRGDIVPYQLAIHFFMIYSINAKSRRVTLLCKKGLTEITLRLLLMDNEQYDSYEMLVNQTDQCVDINQADGSISPVR